MEQFYWVISIASIPHSFGSTIFLTIKVVRIQGSLDPMNRNRL
jgi:hypothetical protein